MCWFINALDGTIQPVFTLPYCGLMTNVLNGPPGSLYLVNPTGGVTTDIFLILLEHLKITRTSQEKPVLLIPDSHRSYVPLETIEFARANSIRLRTLPPHCSHKMQPLDKAVFDPFKTVYNRAASNLLSVEHNAPLRAMYYHIPKCVRVAFKFWPWCAKFCVWLFPVSKINIEPIREEILGLRNIITVVDYFSKNQDDFLKGTKGLDRHRNKCVKAQ